MKINRLNFSVILIILSVQISHTQTISLGIKTGLSCSTPYSYTIIGENKYPIYDFKKETRFSLLPGVYANLPLKNSFYFQTEVSLVDKGITVRGIMKEKLINYFYYLHFPQMLQYHFLENKKKSLNIYVEAGPYFSRALYTGVKSFDSQGDLTDNIKNESAFELHRKIDIGAGIGAGTEIKTDIGNFLINLRYEHSILNLIYNNLPTLVIDPVTGIEALSTSYKYNRIFLLTIGYHFSIIKL